MPAATFYCNSCKARFQLISISVIRKNEPRFCPYCGKDTVEPLDVTLC